MPRHSTESHLTFVTFEVNKVNYRNNFVQRVQLDQQFLIIRLSLSGYLKNSTHLFTYHWCALWYRACHQYLTVSKNVAKSDGKCTYVLSRKNEVESNRKYVCFNAQKYVEMYTHIRTKLTPNAKYTHSPNNTSLQDALLGKTHLLTSFSSFVKHFLSLYLCNCNYPFYPFAYISMFLKLPSFSSFVKHSSFSMFLTLLFLFFVNMFVFLSLWCTYNICFFLLFCLSHSVY